MCIQNLQTNSKTLFTDVKINAYLTRTVSVKRETSNVGITVYIIHGGNNIDLLITEKEFKALKLIINNF